MSKPNEFQQKVLDASGNVLVNASAGSGKTSTMIKKIIGLLDKGVNIKNILVITFTVAAASEMKQKLVDKIYENARKNNANYSNLIKQLDYIPFANICTIDSFCLGIFQKYFALVGRDPSSSLIDPDEVLIILNGIIDSVCEEYISSADVAFLDLAKHFSQSRRLDTLKEAIVSLYYFIDSQEDFENYKANVLLNDNINLKIVAYFREYFDKTVSSLLSETTNYFYILPLELKDEIAKINYIKSSLKQVAQEKDMLVALKKLLIICENELPKKISKLAIKDKIKEYYKLLKDVFEEFENYYKLLIESKIDVHKEKLIEIAIKVQEEYFQYKYKRNLVDFNDLKHYTLKILQNDKARDEIRNDLEYIFVDEYQDTDYLQESMLKAISRGDNVFVVGDMKQSIYRFRFAEPKIFYTRMQEYDNLKTGTNIPLSINYRSDERVLNFVNEVCSEIMTDDFCHIDYNDGAQLKAGKNFEKFSQEPACAIYTYTRNSQTEKRKGYYSVKNEILESKNDVEGEFIAGKIKELTTSIMIDDGCGKARAIEYKDIALLAMRRNNFTAILAELDKNGIPYNLDNDTEDVNPDREVLVDFLRILTNMAQDIPLANVLTSKMFDFQLPELLSIQNINPKPTFSEAFYTYSVEDDLKNKIATFLNVLEEYRFKASYMKVTDLLVEVMANGYDAYLLSKGDKAIEKINTFINYVAERKENDSIEAFVYFYDNTYKGNKVKCDNKAITVTTIHKSKGLEYPVVFLVGAHALINNRQNAAKVYTDKDFGVAVKSFDDEAYQVEDNFSTEIFKLKAKIEQRQELARLLYVAITRAQNHLIITGCVTKEEKAKDLYKANSFMDFLLYAKQRNGKFSLYFQEINEENNEPIVVVEREKVASQAIDLAMLDMLYPYQASTKSALKYSVSQIVDRGQDNKAKQLFDHVDVDTGINYHTVLQYIDYNADSKEKINLELLRLIGDNRISEEATKTLDINKLEKIMSSEIMVKARNAKILREQPFMLYTDSIDGATTLQDKVLVQGVIDLLIIDKTVTLVDFKASYGNPNYLKEKYSKQLELYAKAVEKTMGHKVDKKIIYNILLDFTVELD